MKKKYLLENCPICSGVMIVPNDNKKLGTCISVCREHFIELSEDYKRYEIDKGGESEQLSKN
ncbi:MAG: hypothetical protein FWC00_01500 [Firmicutes bacterium]|nr:hypothetical protein [Bacillota bacterium]